MKLRRYMRKIMKLAIVFGVIAITGCSVNPEKPAVKDPVALPKVKNSTLEVKASVNYQFLTNLINQAVPHQLYWVTGGRVDRCPVSECSYQIRVLRNGSITVSHNAAGNLVINVPITTRDGRIDAMKRVLGAKIRKHATVSANVNVSGSIGFTLTPEWGAKPYVGVNFDVKSAQARISFPGGSVGISVKTVLRNALNGNKATIVNAITRAVNGKLNFKDIAKKDGILYILLSR